MLGTYGWIFVTGIIVFFLVIVFLLFFTRSPIELPLSFSGGDSDFDDWPVESEEQVASLPEDARLSYERAKGNQSFCSVLFYATLSFYCIQHTHHTIPI